jgi:hypothetical protein
MMDTDSTDTFSYEDYYYIHYAPYYAYESKGEATIPKPRLTWSQWIFKRVFGLRYLRNGKKNDVFLDIFKWNAPMYRSRLLHGIMRGNNYV